MAIRAIGIDDGPRGRESLEAIAASTGVSRETVRRARNELVTAIRSKSTLQEPLQLGLLGVHQSAPSREGSATPRALRRMLTMTGPLPWDEALTAWARAGGKYPYLPLPASAAPLRLWIESVGGFTLNQGTDKHKLTVGTQTPEELDQVSAFLYETLRGHASGIDRALLLGAAESAGLKATTIATALSTHPAVLRLGRSTWALRGQQNHESITAIPLSAPRLVERTRPTSFSWTSDGSLAIEFSVPRGPSPVVAVPQAISELVEGRVFTIAAQQGLRRITVGNARLWGFGTLVSELGLVAGQRARLLIDLLAGSATLSPAIAKEEG